MRRLPLSVLVATLAFVASQVHLAVMLLPLRPNVVALQLAFTAEAFWRILDGWGDAGVALFRVHFAWDGVHPFLYGAFGALVVARTPLFDGVSTRGRRAVLWMLPVAAGCDLVENALHLHLIDQPHGTGAMLVAVSSTFSLIKWGLAAGFAVALAMRLVRRWGGKSASKGSA